MCWGNNYGKLGDGTKTSSSIPVAVKGVVGAHSIAAAWGHTCVLIGGGKVICWGSNSAGQLGDGTTIDKLTPVPVKGL